MNKQMKIWSKIRNHMVQHANNLQPFVWVYNDVTLNLNTNQLSSSSFEVKSEYQCLIFEKGNMKDLLRFCADCNIEV